ncbi:MAG: hypothetical protein RLZZ349_237, partial [Pseudomonadota bacterium]
MKVPPLSVAHSTIHLINRFMVLIAWCLIFSLGFSAKAQAEDEKDADYNTHGRHATATHSGSYEAPLPVELSTDPDLCAYVPCSDVFPNADYFSTRKGRPAYVEAYRSKKVEDKENGHHTQDENRVLLGYVFLSTDIVDIPAYSGKPVVTLMGMDVSGKIVGVKVLKHSEPILLVGIPERELTKFI